MLFTHGPLTPDARNCPRASDRPASVWHRISCNDKYANAIHLSTVPYAYTDRSHSVPSMWILTACTCGVELLNRWCTRVKHTAWPWCRRDQRNPRCTICHHRIALLRYKSVHILALWYAAKLARLRSFALSRDLGSNLIPNETTTALRCIAVAIAFVNRLKRFP